MSANAAWAAHLVALRREPPDGLGTIAPTRTNVAASSIGHASGWTLHGAGQTGSWPARCADSSSGVLGPSATGTSAGYSTVSARDAL